MPRLAKGSAEAKAHMAKIRAMRKGGKSHLVKGSAEAKAHMARVRAAKES